MSNGLPSLGTATGSRVDSAAKHIMACKVDTKLLASWLPSSAMGNSEQFMHQNKLQFCMHKDEIVLNTSRRLVESMHVTHAYPMVITTLGDMEKTTKLFLAHLYSQSSASEFYSLIESLKRNPSNAGYYNRFWRDSLNATHPDHSTSGTNYGDNDKIVREIRELPDFRCQGVALGQAFASYLSGDTVASVFVGGVVTVQNGIYPMNSGDLVQWYFHFETSDFDAKGLRDQKRIRQASNDPNIFSAVEQVGGEYKQRHVDKRQKYMDERLFGGSAGMGSGNSSHGVKSAGNMIFIKSYKPLLKNGRATEHYGDKCRVFAKCISGGRGTDSVDIMIMTQSS